MDEGRRKYEETGRRLVVIALALLVATSLVVGLLVTITSPERGIRAIIRTVVTVGLVLAVWNGLRWAYWLTMVLFGLAAVAAPFLADHPAIWGLSAIYAVALFLLGRPAAQDFLRGQRGRPEER